MPSSSVFVAFFSPDNLDAIPQEGHFTAKWRLRNNGNTHWGDGFRLAYLPAASTARLADKSQFDLAEIASQPTVAPGEEVELTLQLTAPATFGRLYRSTWQLKDAQGRLFGHTIFVRVVVVERPPLPIDESLLVSDSQFVADLTIPDDSQLSAGTPFLKQWLVKNNGQRKWDNRFRLVYVGGDDPFTGIFSHVAPDTEPGQEAILTLPMVAPTAPRSSPYISYWRLHDDRNNPFGNRFWAKIIVTQPERPLPTTPFSQKDPRWSGMILGFGPRTIGEFGCLLVCMTMIVNAYGENTTPDQLNNRFKQVGGFQNDLVFFRAPALAFSHIQFDNVNWKPLPDTGATGAVFDSNLISRLDQHLGRGDLALLQVDQVPSTAYNPGVEQHWVVAIARTGNDYYVIDPLDGKGTSLLAKYGPPDSSSDSTETLKRAIKSVLFYS